MTHIIFDEKRIRIDNGQTVLSALLEHDYEIPNSCQAGVCQSCLMQAIDGEIPASAQSGLKDTLKAQGYFLACSCKPTSPLHVITPNNKDLKYSVSVIEHTLLTTDILRLRLQKEKAFEYHGGQFITIWKTQTLGRSYSLASVAEQDDFLELHIRLIPDGQISSWLHNDIKIGDTLNIQQASGNCFYTAGNADQKILLAGTGTGLAPLIGIARDALQQQHKGDIHLIHGTRNIEDLYLHQTLLNMAKENSQFYYHASVLDFNDNISEENSLSTISAMPIEQQIMMLLETPQDWKAYLCGDAEIVNTLKKKIFLSGMNMSDIYSDPFIISPSPQS